MITLQFGNGNGEHSRAGKPSPRRMIAQIQRGLRAIGIPEGAHLTPSGTLDTATMRALNAYLRATQRQPMTQREVMRNLPGLSQELDVQASFAFEGWGAGWMTETLGISADSTFQVPPPYNPDVPQAWTEYDREAGFADAGETVTVERGVRQAIIRLQLALQAAVARGLLGGEPIATTGRIDDRTFRVLTRWLLAHEYLPVKIEHVQANPALFARAVEQNLPDLVSQPMLRGWSLGAFPSVVEQIKAAQQKRSAATAGARSATPRDGRVAYDARVARLQKALRAAGIRDDRGKLVAADGIFGKHTLAAVNNWRASQRVPAMTARQVIDSLDDLTEAIARFSVPAAQRTLRPEAARSAQPASIRQPSEGTRVGEFVCAQGNCRPATQDAMVKARQLQTLLNQMPPHVVAAYPRGKPLRVDGIIGAATVTAMRAVIGAAEGRKKAEAAQRGEAPPSDAVSQATVTPESIASSIGPYIERTSAELLLQRQLAAGQVASKSVWKVTSRGNVVGNNRFRCLAMGLQVQLNRFGQRLAVEGVIGPNTTTSVERVLGGKWTPSTIAANLEALAFQVKRLADEKGLPPPSPGAGGAAFAKCATEVTQPSTDARVIAISPQGQQAVTREPTTAPPPTPTPTEQQPLPPPLTMPGPEAVESVAQEAEQAAMVMPMTPEAAGMVAQEQAQAAETPMPEAMPAEAVPPAPAPTTTGGGLPWGWIVGGVVALGGILALGLSVGGRSGDRSSA